MRCDDLQNEKTLISPGVFLTDYLSDRKVSILINIFHTLYFIIMQSSHQLKSSQHNYVWMRRIF